MVLATLKPLSSWEDTKVKPKTIPRIWVVPIFLVMDQIMPTGSRWNTASPISQRKLYMPSQNWETSARLMVPFSKKLISPMMFRKANTKPPAIKAGIRGAKISPNAPIIRCNGF